LQGWQLKLLAALFVVAVVVGDTERVVADTQAPSAQASTCPHKLDKYGRRTWKPTDLHLTLARHRGWLQKEKHIDLREPDVYLDPVEPDWRRAAVDHPEQANLCNADLEDEPLDGAVLTGSDLHGASLRHLSGAHLSGADMRGADLSGADLHGAYLGVDDSGLHFGSILFIQGADLTGADLSEANLAGVHSVGANLKDADLSGAILTCIKGQDGQQRCAQLTRADLSGTDMLCEEIGRVDLKGAERSELKCTDLSGAKLSSAKLIGANLSGAIFSKAKLDGADLTEADLSCFNPREPRREHQECSDLSGVDLSDAQVSKVKLAGVDLTGATYAPVSEPPYPYVASIKGLDTLNVPPGDLTGLVQLRKLFRDAGLGDEEREVTYSIQRGVTVSRLSSAGFARIEGVLRIVGFKWTTAYGLHPEWALRWILLLGALLAPVYMLAMLHPTSASGIVQVFPADRLDGTAGDPADEQKRKKQLVHAKGWLVALPNAAYFSLISAVNIGFEQFTPGDWIRRLQKRAYSLEAVGWVRVIAGIQALLSVYLLAMWVLTQFGQLFR